MGDPWSPPYDSMPERSKGSGSSSDVFVLVGSNPTAVKILFLSFFYLIYINIYIYIYIMATGPTRYILDADANNIIFKKQDLVTTAYVQVGELSIASIMDIDLLDAETRGGRKPPASGREKVIYNQTKMDNLDCAKDGEGSYPNAAMLANLHLFDRPPGDPDGNEPNWPWAPGAAPRDMMAADKSLEDLERKIIQNNKVQQNLFGRSWIDKHNNSNPMYIYKNVIWESGLGPQTFLKKSTDLDQTTGKLPNSILYMTFGSVIDALEKGNSSAYGTPRFWPEGNADAVEITPAAMEIFGFGNSHIVHGPRDIRLDGRGRPVVPYGTPKSFSISIACGNACSAPTAPTGCQISYDSTSRTAVQDLANAKFFFEGNNQKTMKLKNSNTGEDEKVKIIVAKEFGDKIQVLLYLLMIKTIDPTFGSTIMTCGDTVVFCLCVMLDIPCIYAAKTGNSFYGEGAQFADMTNKYRTIHFPGGLDKFNLAYLEFLNKCREIIRQNNDYIYLLLTLRNKTNTIQIGAHTYNARTPISFSVTDFYDCMIEDCKNIQYHLKKYILRFIFGLGADPGDSPFIRYGGAAGPGRDGATLNQTFGLKNDELLSTMETLKLLDELDQNMFDGNWPWTSSVAVGAAGQFQTRPWPSYAGADWAGAVDGWLTTLQTSCPDVCAHFPHYGRDAQLVMIDGYPHLTDARERLYKAMVTLAGSAAPILGTGSATRFGLYVLNKYASPRDDASPRYIQIEDYILATVDKQVLNINNNFKISSMLGVLNINGSKLIFPDANTTKYTARPFSPVSKETKPAFEARLRQLYGGEFGAYLESSRPRPGRQADHTTKSAFVQIITRELLNDAEALRHLAKMDRVARYARGRGQGGGAAMSGGGIVVDGEDKDIDQLKELITNKAYIFLLTADTPQETQKANEDFLEKFETKRYPMIGSIPYFPPETTLFTRADLVWDKQDEEDQRYWSKTEITISSTELKARIKSNGHYFLLDDIWPIDKSVYDEWVADISLWDSAIVKMKSLSEDGLENAMVDQLLRVDLLADEIKQGIEQKNFMISASAVDGASQLHIYDDEKKDYIIFNNLRLNVCYDLNLILYKRLEFWLTDRIIPINPLYKYKEEIMTIGEAYMLYLKYSDIGLMPGIPLIDNKTEQDNKDEVFYEYMNILLHLELGLVPDITGSKYYLIAYQVIMNWDENIFTDWQQAEAELRNTEAVEAAKRQRAMQRAVTRADAERETTVSVRPTDFVMGSVTSAAAAQAPPPPRGVKRGSYRSRTPPPRTPDSVTDSVLTLFGLPGGATRKKKTKNINKKRKNTRNKNKNNKKQTKKRYHKKKKTIRR